MDIKLKVLIVDISGKVPLYDFSLVEALSKNTDIDIKLAIPKKIKNKSFKTIKFFRLPISDKLTSSTNIFKRVLKSAEVLINYFILFIYILFNKYKIIHFQWLPFLEISVIEKYILYIFKKVSNKSKFIFTVHNIYPHNCINKENYKKRFLKTKIIFDYYIFHTQSSLKKFYNEFNIHKNLIVIPHGIFNKNIFLKKEIKNLKFHILHFGGLSEYKGTDILVQALKLLPEEDKKSISVNIMGRISNPFFSKLKQLSDGLNINWFPYFVDDEFLYSHLHCADLVVFPYREIDQSGALLSALWFEKPILTSDLPSFVETLHNFDENWFFKNGDAIDLAEKISNHINNFLERDKMIDLIRELKNEYSWDNSASQTLNLYKSISYKN